MRIKLGIFIAVLIFVSCMTTKTLTTPGTLDKKSVALLVEKIQKNEPQFTTANVSKMSLALEMNNRKVNVNATCKIQKDSAIHISIQPFMGIELFKAELTSDSIKVFDKMNYRSYFVDYKYFTERFGVEIDFNSLQALIFGKFFSVGEKEIPFEKLIETITTNNHKKIDFENGNMHQSTELMSDFKIQQVSLKSLKNNYELMTDYSDYSFLNGVNFPQKIRMQASNQKKQAICEFSILRVEFNSPVKFQSTNPARYIQSDIEQLLKK